MLKSLQDEIKEAGYHIFSVYRQKTLNHYPGAFNNYPGVSFNTLSLNDMITIKVFYIKDSENCGRTKDIYLDLSVKELGSNEVEAMTLSRVNTLPS